MIEYIHIQQGTDRWKTERLGIITASRMKDVMAKGRGGNESLTRRRYINELVEEIYTGVSLDYGINDSMEWGSTHETEAADYYMGKTMQVVDTCGMFIDRDNNLGASPDRLVGRHGLIEIKCPNTETHIKYLKSNKIPTNYLRQVDTQLMLSGRLWCDWVSYDPRAENEEDRMLIIRRYKDEDAFEEIMDAVFLFNLDLQSSVELRYTS